MRLEGRRVLVVEDLFLIAYDLRDRLANAGATVVGPAPTVDRALAILANDNALDGAIVDICLHGEMAYPVLDELTHREIPFVVASGYERTMIPSGFRPAAYCPKASSPVDAVEALDRALNGVAASPA